MSVVVGVSNTQFPYKAVRGVANAGSYSGVVYEGGYDEDFIVEKCDHQHKTARAARECGEAMAAARRENRTSAKQDVRE